jgi:simple sugar transport system permease protein
MSAGRGWVALVIIFLGGRKPQGVLAAAFIFALADAFSNHAQGLWKLPPDFILAFPYAATFAALVIFSMRKDREKDFSQRRRTFGSRGAGDREEDFTQRRKRRRGRRLIT